MQVGLTVPLSTNGKSIFHIKDVRFGRNDSETMNVLCANTNVNIKDNHEVITGRSKDLQTFMQVIHNRLFYEKMKSQEKLFGIS